MILVSYSRSSLPTHPAISLSLSNPLTRARSITHFSARSLSLPVLFPFPFHLYPLLSLPHSPSLPVTLTPLLSQISAAIEAPQRRISCPASRFVKIPYFSIIIYYRGCREAVDEFWCHFSGSGPVHCCWLCCCCCCCCCCCLQRARTCLLLLLPLVLVLLFLLLLLLLTDRKN